MNFVDPQAPILDVAADSYRYSAQGFVPIESYIEKAIRGYDPEYGPYLLEHLNTTSAKLYSFLRTMDKYSEQEAINLSNAFKLHDAGKVLQDISLWKITQEKPKRSEFEKTERPRHTDLGLVVLDQAMKETGFEPAKDDYTHLNMIRRLMSLHHERIDGRGPKGMSDLDDVLKIVGIIDAADGKMKAYKGDMAAVLDDMKHAEKHKGEFDPELLERYTRFETKGLALGYSFSGQGLAIPSIS